MPILPNASASIKAPEALIKLTAPQVACCVKEEPARSELERTSMLPRVTEPSAATRTLPALVMICVPLPITTVLLLPLAMMLTSPLTPSAPVVTSAASVIETLPEAFKVTLPEPDVTAAFIINAPVCVSTRIFALPAMDNIWSSVMSPDLPTNTMSSLVSSVESLVTDNPFNVEPAVVLDAAPVAATWFTTTSSTTPSLNAVLSVM